MTDIQDAKVVPAQPRTDAQVKFTDGRIYEGPLWTELRHFVDAAGAEKPWAFPIVAALIDDELRELTYHIDRDVEVTALGTDDRDGSRIYRRSLTFLLVVAVHQLFPDAMVTVDHSVTFGGYYCEVQGRPQFTAEELAAVQDRMVAIVGSNAPIGKQRVPLAEAIDLFRSRGEEDKVRLLQHRQKDYLVLYELCGFRGYFHGYMAPSAGYISTFALQYYAPGFVLRFPQRQSMELEPVVEYPKLVGVFRDYGATLRLLGLDDVGSLNTAITAGRANEIMLVAEARHEDGIASIATQIANGGGRAKLVLIAGPSSSGKTTFSKRLAVQLLAHGVRPIAIEMDNYFLDRELTPKDDEGNYDFECLEALDLALFNRDLSRLMAGDEVQLPRYNFLTGKREEGSVIQLGPDQILLIEGIHGLNSRLAPGASHDSVFRIYISALTQLNIDRHNRVSTTDNRLIRRIVRDARTRGYTAADTIGRWESVHRGERTHIFPYQENADAMFNSALVYELSVLKTYAEPLLLQLEPGKPGYVEAHRLLAFLNWFEPMPSELIPYNSILREFVGGGNLEHFEPWRRA
jgi:uridine kinase